MAALLLGIDTGGTFTDAVLLDDATQQVIAHAKSPTTHDDLTLGVSRAVERVLDGAGVGVTNDVVLVSLSTTLATNALVEGHGEPAGLLTFGFSRRELERTGLGAAVEADLLLALDGGHDAHGNERVPLDLDVLQHAVQDLAPRVTAFAVAAQFSVRNPAHERAAAELVRSVTGLPVTSSSDLSAKLDGPRRALTAALNARLLGTIARLHQAVQSVLAAQSIDAPIMVVRGDGSLVSAAFAEERPIETVLSGPAASVIGALHLAELNSGLVVDIGGTTTDVAVISEGRPSVTDGGAVVGNHRTMVEAVEMATAGLGGDSEVRIDTRAPQGPLVLGPERAIPMCRLVNDYPALHDVLDRQLGAPVGLTSHGRFLVSVAPADVVLTDEREINVLERLRPGPLPLAEAATSALATRAAARLQARGLVRVATMTPTDASALLTAVPGADVEGARKVAAILARQTASNGSTIAANAEELAQQVLDKLIYQSASFVVQSALRSDGLSPTADDQLVHASLERRSGASVTAIGLADPLTAIGAPAAAYYPAVADLAHTTVVVPPFAQVANAIGAVVGRVRVRRSATITQPSRGQYRVHFEDQPTFGSVDNARAAAQELLERATLKQAEEAGASSPELTATWSERVAVIDGRDVFVEGLLSVEASGRPRF